MCLGSRILLIASVPHVSKHLARENYGFLTLFVLIILMILQLLLSDNISIIQMSLLSHQIECILTVRNKR